MHKITLILTFKLILIYFFLEHSPSPYKDGCRQTAPFLAFRPFEHPSPCRPLGLYSSSLVLPRAKFSTGAHMCTKY